LPVRDGVYSAATGPPILTFAPHDSSGQQHQIPWAGWAHSGTGDGGLSPRTVASRFAPRHISGGTTPRAARYMEPQRGIGPRYPPYQSGALPLSYKGVLAESRVIETHRLWTGAALSRRARRPRRFTLHVGGRLTCRSPCPQAPSRFGRAPRAAAVNLPRVRRNDPLPPPRGDVEPQRGP
jgi:hypothetical protein